MAERRDEPAPALTRNVLIPLSILACFVLVYVVEVRPYWVFPIGGLVMLLYLAAPLLGRRSLERFDRDLVRLLATGKKGEVAARFNRSIGMRLFSPPALVAERKGMAMAEVGDAKGAVAAYQHALEGYGAGAAPLAVRLGLAHALFATGADDDAIRLYRTIMKETAGLPNVARNLAHALARKGESAEARRLLDELGTDDAAAIRELIGPAKPAKKKKPKKKVSRPNA